MAPGLVARMVVGFVLATAGMADAGRRPVAVIDLTESTPASELAIELHKALQNHPDLQPLDNPVFNGVLQGRFADEDANPLTQARKYKQFADDALAQLDDDGARRSARAGLDMLSYVQPTEEMLGLYAELIFVYGQAQLGLRKPNDASRAFQLAHRIDPKRSPDPTRYPPNIIAAYKAAADKPTTPAKLVVRGTGRVWIDGIEQGPAGTYDVAEGLHLVQLFGPDRETRGDQVTVPSSMPLNIQDAPASPELKVKRARIALARARDPAERASMMKKLAALLGVGDAVLIAKDLNGPLTVQTWRDREPGFSALMIHRDEQPIELLKPLAPPSMKIEKKFEPLPNPPPLVDERRWYQKNWVRASIAGGVIVGVVSAILYAQRDKFLPPNTMDVTWKDMQ